MGIKDKVIKESFMLGAIVGDIVGSPYPERMATQRGAELVSDPDYEKFYDEVAK